ncbi:MAG: TlpA family protein disulfide reductase [Chlorobi bacterium]|nr:TlpA family protein disulfide reductase [Chlorobiota bacterium]
MSPENKKTGGGMSRQIEVLKHVLIALVLLVPVSHLGADGKKGEDAWNFTLKDLADNDVSLHDYKNNVVLVNFWATWCGPCKREIPDLISLQKEFGPEGLQVLGIALDKKGRKIVEPFAEKAGFNFPILIGDYQTIQKYGGFRAIPTSFLIDRTGKIVKVFRGLTRYEEFTAVIKKFL